MSHTHISIDIGCYARSAQIQMDTHFTENYVLFYYLIVPSSGKRFVFVMRPCCSWRAVASQTQGVTLRISI